MKKNIALSIFIIIFIIEVFLPNTVLGSNSGYKIESYDINMVVNEDNTFDITETISVYFTELKHGIYRKIPLRNTVERADGTKSNNRTKISNIQVSETFRTYNEDGCKVIKIGQEDENVVGRHKYAIKYTYNIGKDSLKNADELYFNLIGDEWDTSISNVNFSITMPKKFDKTKLGFSSGYINSTGSSNVKYTVSGNIIKGSVENTLEPGQALTVRLTLPEGYFVGASRNINYMILLQILIQIVFIITAYNLWRKYGKDEKNFETIEFYPPDNLNSVDIGFLYKGYVEEKDIVSLLIYLANKRYLKIEESEEKISKITKVQKIKIIKLKEYDGNDENERIFFNDLFKSKNEVELKELQNKFYLTIDKIVNNVNKRENQEKIFEKTSLGKSKLIIGMILIIFISIILNSNIFRIDGIIGATKFLAFLLPLLIPLVHFIWREQSVAVSIILIILTTCLLMFFVPEIYFDNMVIFISNIICIDILLIILGTAKKRSKYGNKMLGKIKGFKKFLEIAEKPKLEELVMENPKYFYDILPYTYVLGVSNKWIDKFEEIALEPPTWYYGYSSFNAGSFNNFINSTYFSISSSMYSSSSSSSSGGGGISGGGSGGGGGGSW